MKNFTCLILLFLSASFLNNLSAQYSFEYYWAFKVTNLMDHAKRFSDSTVSEVKIHSVYKKKVKNTIYIFNEKGRLTEYYNGKENDSTQKKAIITYDEKNQIQKAKFFHKHELDFLYEFAFNEKNKLTELKEIEENGDITKNHKIKYNANGDREEYSLALKNKTEPKFVWKYEYYDKGKLAHTYRYKKGKLKQEWDYMCKEEGEKVTRKNFNKVCQWHESDKDTLTAIYQTTDDEGRMSKSIYKYTIKDTLPLSSSHYNYKNELSTRWTYDKSYDKMLSEAFYKKGKEIYRYQYTFNGDKITSTMYFSKGKMKSKDEFNYNEKNRLTSSKTYDKNNKVIGEQTVTYMER